jgi:hypothetical protein
MHRILLRRSRERVLSDVATGSIPLSLMALDESGETRNSISRLKRINFVRTGHEFRKGLTAKLKHSVLAIRNGTSANRLSPLACKYVPTRLGAIYGALETSSSFEPSSCLKRLA